jgi:uncharacterized protein (DUF362 family)/ferredoxin
MESRVSIVGCRGYERQEVERRFAEAIELAGGFEVRGASVLVKPNLLNVNGYERAVTSHPEFARAAVIWLKEHGAGRVLVGDSPGFQSQDLVGKRSGIREAIESAGAEWADFSEGRELENPEGRLVKRFSLAAPFAEADLLLDLPRLKTHQLMYFSGAIKNLFGLVPGLGKSAFHLRFPGREEFAAMLADLCLAAAPDFSVMDSVVAMEGPGPNNGRPKELDLILASRDPLALDWIASSLVGYDPAKVPYLADLMGRTATGPSAGPVRSRWATKPSEMVVSGIALERARPASFELVPLLKENDFFRSKMPAPIHRLVKNLTVPRPAFDAAKCVLCGGCVRICPAKALSVSTGPKPRIEIDYRACLRCYCCHEVCPEDAIRLVKRPF